MLLQKPSLHLPTMSRSDLAKNYKNDCRCRSRDGVAYYHKTSSFGRKHTFLLNYLNTVDVDATTVCQKLHGLSADRRDSRGRLTPSAASRPVLGRALVDVDRDRGGRCDNGRKMMSLQTNDLSYQDHIFLSRKYFLTFV